MTLGELRRSRPAILAAASRRGARSVRVFGSVARGDATATSDVDFLAGFGPERSLLDQVHLIELAARIGPDFEAWSADEDLRLVTERLVEIIGEAARAMTAEGRAHYPGVDWTGLIGMRNVLVHAYHRIQPELLWNAASIDIPAGMAELER